MEIRRFARREFHHVGRIEPEFGPDAVLLRLMPQMRYKQSATTPLHAYGSGPFCRFRIARGRHAAGLYVLTVDDIPMYAGECVDLGQRWGPNGYGGVSPRNCFRGGQPTNCRVNAAILVAADAGQRIDLWFCAFDGDTESRRMAETELIRTLAPSWNRSKLVMLAP